MILDALRNGRINQGVTYQQQLLKRFSYVVVVAQEIYRVKKNTRIRNDVVLSFFQFGLKIVPPKISSQSSSRGSTEHNFISLRVQSIVFLEVIKSLKSYVGTSEVQKSIFVFDRIATALVSCSITISQEYSGPISEVIRLLVRQNAISECHGFGRILRAAQRSQAPLIAILKSRIKTRLSAPASTLEMYEYLLGIPL